MLLPNAVWWLLQIRTIDRKQEVPHDGAMCDLLWSDPGELVRHAAAGRPVTVLVPCWSGAQNHDRTFNTALNTLFVGVHMQSNNLLVHVASSY